MEGQQNQEVAKPIRKSLKHQNPTALYFGSVSIQGPAPAANLKAMTQLACQYMDIVTTSGEGTGIAAGPAKVKEMHTSRRRQAPGDRQRNHGGKLQGLPPYITWYLVATGISLILTKDVDFYNPDPYLSRGCRTHLRRGKNIARVLAPYATI